MPGLFLPRRLPRSSKQMNRRSRTRILSPPYRLNPSPTAHSKIGAPAHLLRAPVEPMRRDDPGDFEIGRSCASGSRAGCRRSELVARCWRLRFGDDGLEVTIRRSKNGPGGLRAEGGYPVRGPPAHLPDHCSGSDLLIEARIGGAWVLGVVRRDVVAATHGHVVMSLAGWACKPGP